MSDNTFNNKNFINPEEVLGDPKNAFDLLVQGAKSASPFNMLGQPGFRKAKVIEGAEAVTDLESAALGIPASPGRVAAFMYWVRLADEWNEHMLLPTPCDVGSNSRNADLRPCHLMVVGSQDVQFGSTIRMNEGDYVDVDMQKGNFQNDLQRARHAGMSSRPRSRGSGLECPATRTISKQFNNMPPSDSVISGKQKKFQELLEHLYGGPVTVNSYTRTPEEQADAMLDLPLADLKTMYKGGSMSAAAAALVTAKTSGDAEVKESEFNRAVALIQAAVDQGKGSTHLTGNALDIRTWDMSVDNIDSLRYHVKEIGGRVNLEPTKTKCWSDPAAGDPSSYGNFNLSRLVSTTGEGNCYNEHLHIDWPSNWEPPFQTS